MKYLLILLFAISIAFSNVHENRYHDEKASVIHGNRKDSNYCVDKEGIKKILVTETPLKLTIKCTKSDSIKISISNYGSEAVCFHAPEEVHSFFEKGYVHFAPKFSKNIAHMEGRPFSIDCLQPYKEGALEQEYKKSYTIANVFDKNAKNIKGFYFSIGSWDEFKFLKDIGKKDYKRQVDFLNERNEYLVSQCEAD